MSSEKVRMSRTIGTPVIVDGSSESSAAAMIGRVAFFDPLTRTFPFNTLPPCNTIFFTDFLPYKMIAPMKHLFNAVIGVIIWQYYNTFAAGKSKGFKRPVLIPCP